MKRCAGMLEKIDGTVEQCDAPAEAISVGEVHEFIEQYHRGRSNEVRKSGRQP
jgi:hypothetical protein